MATKFDKFVQEEFEYHGIHGECGMDDMMGGHDDGDHDDGGEVINITDLGGGVDGDDDHGMTGQDGEKVKIELDMDSAKYLLHVLLGAMENNDDGEDNGDGESGGDEENGEDGNPFAEFENSEEN